MLSGHDGKNKHRIFKNTSHYQRRETKAVLNIATPHLITEFLLREKWWTSRVVLKQGRIHGNPVADGWAGAVMRKPLANQKSDLPTDLPTYRPTRQVLESRVRD